MTPVLEKPYISVSINPENMIFLHFTNGGHTRKSIMAAPMFLRIKRSIGKCRGRCSFMVILAFLELRVWKTISLVLSGRLRITSFKIVQEKKINTIDGESIYIVINTVNPSNAVNSIKQPHVLKGNLFLILSLTISYEFSLFYSTFCFMCNVL